MYNRYDRIMSTTINIRTDAKVKKSAMRVLKGLGLDLSTAINIYLVQVVEKKGIPFSLFLDESSPDGSSTKIPSSKT